MRLILIIVFLVISGLSMASQTQIATSFSEIPPEVVKALDELCDPCSFADVNEPWNSSDVLNNLPQRHLISASRSGAEWTIQYEHGGRGRHDHTATFTTTPIVHFVHGSSYAPDDGCHEW